MIAKIRTDIILNSWHLLKVLQILHKELPNLRFYDLFNKDI